MTAMLLFWPECWIWRYVFSRWTWRQH